MISLLDNLTTCFYHKAQKPVLGETLNTLKTIAASILSIKSYFEPKETPLP